MFDLDKTINDSIKPVFLDEIQQDNSIAVNDKQVDMLNESYVAQVKTYKLQTEKLSEKAKKSHIDLYKSTIEALNDVSARLDTASRKEDEFQTSELASLKCLEIKLLNSVYMHELFFSNVSDLQSEIHMDALAYMRLSRDFGTFDRWQFDFIATALSSLGGWACTVYSTFLRRYINVSIHDHSVGIPMGCYPVIVIDMHEHSYFKDYMTNAKGYVSNMMKELNWNIIEDRFKRAELIEKALRV